MTFHGWTYIPLGCHQIHIICKNGSFKSMKFLILKKSTWSQYVVENNLRDCLNFESLAPLKFQRSIKDLKIMKRKKRKEKMG